MKKFLIISIFVMGLFFSPNIVFAQGESEPVCCINEIRTEKSSWTNWCGKTWIGDVVGMDRCTSDWSLSGCRLKTTAKPCKIGVQTKSNCNEYFGLFDFGAIVGRGLSGISDKLDQVEFISGVMGGEGLPTECPQYMETEMKCLDYVPPPKYSDICNTAVDYWRKYNGIDECHNKNDKRSCNNTGACFWSEGQGTCFEAERGSECPHINSEFDCARSNKCKWDFESTTCIDEYQQYINETYGTRDSGKFMPPCAVAGTCNSIGDLLGVPLMFAKEIFKYVGALAFIFFIIGGITMVLSFGNQEKVAKGKGIIVAAVIGLIIVVGAYFITDFIIKSFGVSIEFRPE